MGRVSPFGNPWIKDCSHLPTAYRRVLRPSSPLDAKASTERPYWRLFPAHSPAPARHGCRDEAPQEGSPARSPPQQAGANTTKRMSVMLGERGLNLRQGPALWSDILTIFKNASPRAGLRPALVPRAGGAGPSRRLATCPFGARTLRQAEERERIQGRTRDRSRAGLRGQDLNLRPSGYEPDELPGCSTPRYVAVSPVVEPAGFEPATPCLQSRCSPAELRPRREDKGPAGKTRAPAGKRRPQGRGAAPKRRRAAPKRGALECGGPGKT